MMLHCGHVKTGTPEPYTSKGQKRKGARAFPINHTGICPFHTNSRNLLITQTNPRVKVPGTYDTQAGVHILCCVTGARGGRHVAVMDHWWY